MEQKENQRIRLTKALLTEALLKMLQEQPIHTISIRDLCERAGINRTTFYHHYGSQYDLLYDITGRFLTQIAEQLAAADSDNRDSVLERVTLVFQYLEDNLELSRLLLNSSVDPCFADKLFALPKISDLLDASLRDCCDPQQRQAVISFAIYGSYHLLKEWINQDRRLPAEAEAGTVLDLARRVCAVEGYAPCGR